jgi:sulfur-oxidizing protein SoxZ
MALAAARVSMAAEAKKGDIVEIKALIRHPIPRHIITRFTVSYNGEEVFAMDMTQGVAANPFIAFSTVATETGELTFTWQDDLGAVTTVKKTLTVTG